MGNGQRRKKRAKKVDANYITKRTQNSGKTVPIKNPPKNWEQNFHAKMIWLIQSDYVEIYLRLA